ncbi:MAG: rhodanese-like domain-containing protein [Bacteroidia bacterium]|nr:rhodanese-like domain-containing protein [Bacteroidia bacterium]
MIPKVAIASSVIFMLACGQNPSRSTHEMSSSYPQESRTLTAAEAYKRWKENPDQVVILDVRTPDEYQGGHIKGAQNLNLYDDFEKAIQKLPKDKEYYLHCASGRRSGMAMEIMRKHGFRAYNLGGYRDLVQAGFPKE